MRHAIECIDIKKQYGDNIVLNDLNLKVERGEVFGLLGPNGSGKTTLISILSTLIRPDGGKAYIYGLDVVGEKDRVKRKICVVHQVAGFDQLSSAIDYLEFLAAIYGVKERGKVVRRCLKEVGLLGHENKLIMHYSEGMKKRLALCRIFMKPFEVLLLDEPTTGIDIRGKNVIWDRILKYKKKNDTTILLATHDVLEAEKYCDKVGIIHNGRIVASGTVKELISKIGANDVIEVKGYFERGDVIKVLEISGVKSVKVLREKLKWPRVYAFAGTIPDEYKKLIGKEDVLIITLPTELAARMSQDELKRYVRELARKTIEERALVRPNVATIYVNNYADVLPEVMSHLVSRNVKISTISIRKVSLEDAFIAYTGEKLS